MYLKEIVATGFKSFADKTNIVLDDRITCIVGPNGSGKSNVVDAVRFVLGEQSVKSLRGENSMSDVVFSGSKTRSSLNVASVNLIFDNTDHYLNIPYTEVSIKRRLYRTGENEYFLNGEKCRLKDITNLLLDSGIGKEAFNIISQGEISKILSNSPTDRRVIFEEAAGVLKYKKRKEESLRKLDRTNDNLIRISDIILELERQVGPLKEQSEQATLYLENKQALEQIEVALVVQDITNINYEYQQAKEKIALLEQAILDITSTKDESDIELDEKKNKLILLEKEINDQNDLLLAIVKEVEKINGEKNIIQERSKYKADDSKIYDNVVALKEKNKDIENRVTLLRLELEHLKEEITALEQETLVLNKNMQDKRVELTALEQDLTNKKRERVELEHKIEVLRDYVNRGGNLYGSVKAILNNPKLRGIHNTIGNLLSVDKIYSKALEVSLSSSSQFIVVDNENNAKEAISYLQNNNLGRATFFPLSVIKPKGIDEDTLIILTDDADYLGLLGDLVSYEEIYRHIILNQLGNVIVAKDIDAANRISHKIHARYKVVSLNGDIIHVGGSITGGSVNAGKSIISEKQELEDLIRRVGTLEEVIREVEVNLKNTAQAINTYETKVYELNTLLVQKQELYTSKNNDLLGRHDELENTEFELKTLDQVINDSLSKEEEKIIDLYYAKIKEKDELHLVINQLNNNKEILQNIIIELEGQVKVGNSARYGKEKELKELEIKVNRLDVKLDNLLNILSEDYSLTYEKARDSYVLEIDVEEARLKVNLYRNNIKTIGMVNLAAIEDYQKVNERYEFLTKQKNDLEKARETLNDIIKEMDKVMVSEFIHTFKEIEGEFKKVFKDLFAGGQADLKLTNPDNILETGIEIIASPPGKKLTTISLLSGGEKTLTAISLLFAILNVRQVPFCLFDEIEAALDEANVDRFGKYLNNYRGKTQFLIITHKKKTMEYADTLYGITMQESGISKLVSVLLEERK